jgi:hypothetical protein
VHSTLYTLKICCEDTKRTELTLHRIQLQSLVSQDQLPLRTGCSKLDVPFCLVITYEPCNVTPKKLKDCEQQSQEF